MNREETERIFREPPIIDTPRLYLRKILKKDSSDMYEYSKNRDVTKYLLWEPHISEGYTRKYIAYLQGRYRAGDFYDWAVILRLRDKMIGTCGFTRFNLEANSAEIGYVLNPDYWGHGIAPEVVYAVMKFGFSVLRLHRIEAKYMVGNERSRRVMDKLGMTFEGIARDSMHVKGRYVSVGTCAILRDEFNSLYGSK